MRLTQGNSKIGHDTLIFNMTSATDCPSKALGLCALPDKCYAVRDEVRYLQCLPYRRQQAEAWDLDTPEQIAGAILVAGWNKGIRWVRYSEGGDFRCQADVNKMSRISNLLSAYNLKVYGYTARKDLDFSRCDENMTVCGSGFMIHNEFIAAPYPQGRIICPMDCRHCHICKIRRGVKVEVIYH